MRMVVWEQGAWLFPKRWGGLLEMVVYGRTAMQDSRADLAHLVIFVQPKNQTDQTIPITVFHADGLFERPATDLRG